MNSLHSSLSVNTFPEDTILSSIIILGIFFILYFLNESSSFNSSILKSISQLSLLMFLINLIPFLHFVPTIFISILIPPS